MTIGSETKKRLSEGEFVPSKTRVALEPGDALKMLRELQGLSQPELAKLCGIPQTALSAIERKAIKLGVERAKTLARALKVHPAILIFPSWDVEKESKFKVG